MHADSQTLRPDKDPAEDTFDEPFLQVRVGLRHGAGEAQLEVLAAQRVLPVVLDQRVHAGEVQVWRQVEVRVRPLRTRADAAVLDSPAAPEHTHTKGAQGGGDTFGVFRQNETTTAYQKERVKSLT